MQWLNSYKKYGLITVVLHWSLALLIITLFILGLWMVELDYYHSWYHRAPSLHKSFGLCLLALMLLRYGWRLLSLSPTAEPNLAIWEHHLSVLGQHLFYMLILVISGSGYLMVTSDGSGVAVFDWFELPALVSHIDQQEDVLGLVHYYVACGFMVLVVVHAFAAVRHHVIERDRTLLKMFGK
ncbi:MAG: cytochrome b561 [Pseudohongiellaceae bacterium]